jgi:YhcH/YjgK/YiaL family protein
MILDRVENGKRYLALNPHFTKAFAFLQSRDLRTLPLGRHEIDGDRVYATAMRGPGKPREASHLEAHRKYIDIQVVLSGTDEMGWKNKATCKIPHGDYTADKDVEFFADTPDAWVEVGPGAFVVFFPEDTHAPMIGQGELHKIVVKVLAD